METKDGFLVINKDKGCTSHDVLNNKEVLIEKAVTQELLTQKL